MGYLQESERSNPFSPIDAIVQRSFLVETTPPFDAIYSAPEEKKGTNPNPLVELEQEKNTQLLTISEKTFLEKLGKDKAQIAVYLQEQLRSAQEYTDEQQEQGMEIQKAIDTLGLTVDIYNQRNISLEFARFGINKSSFIPRMVQRIISSVQSKQTEGSIRHYQAKKNEEEKRLREISSSEKRGALYRDEFALLLSTFIDGDTKPVLTWLTRTINAKLEVARRTFYKTEFSGLFDSEDALIEASQLADFVQLLDPVEGNRLQRVCDEAREIQKKYQWW
jgi:hypothetical protein